MKRTAQFAPALLLLIVSSCSGGGAVICDDDTVCPAPNMCEPGGGCIIPDPDSFCEVNEDGVLCDDGNGQCTGDECVAFVCGDSVVDANEVCDAIYIDADCTSDGFEFGSLTCADCGGAGTERCGLLGWRQLFGGAFPVGAEMYASGEKIWVVGPTTGNHYDGQVWRRADEFAGTSISGTSADDLWVHASGLVRHYDGENWTQESLGDNLGAIVAVAPNEAYFAGRDPLTTAPTIWRYDGAAWNPIYTDKQAAGGYTDIAIVGDSVVAIRRNAIAVITAGVAREVAVEGMAGTRSVWGRAADDVYVTATTGTFHFDGTEATSVFSRQGQLTGLGDVVYLLGPGTAHEAPSGASFDLSRRVRGVGGAGGGIVNSPVAAFSTGDRILALLSLGGVWEFTGTGFVDIPFDGGVIDLSLNDGTLYSMHTTPNSSDRVVRTISEPFGLTPSSSEGIVSEIVNDIWGKSPAEIFMLAGTDILLWDGVGAPQVVATAANDLRAIEGLGSDRAIAVGTSGEVWTYSGNVWSPAGDATVGTTFLNGAMAAGDGYVAVGAFGSIFVHRGNGWEAVDSGVADSLFAVAGPSTGDFWAVGLSGTIVHCTLADGSTTCVIEGPSTAMLFSDIEVISETDILAVAGDKGLHYDGLRWSEVGFRNRNVTRVAAAGEHIWLGNTQNGLFALERLERATVWSAPSN